MVKRATKAKHGDHGTFHFTDASGEDVKLNFLVGCNNGHRPIFYDCMPDGLSGPPYACPICCERNYSREK